MVYSNKFVMSVLHNDAVQKELANGVVKLPFSAEYTLRFRNKNDRRAVVKIFIDGENVSGNGYIVPANDYVDIKRHHDKDAAFKFVSLESPDAQEFGKDGPNHDKVKGVVEARFYLEKPRPVAPVVKEIHHHHHHDHTEHHHYPAPKPQPWPYYPPVRPMWVGNNRDAQYGTTCNAGDQSGDTTTDFDPMEKCASGGFESAGAQHTNSTPKGDIAQFKRTSLNATRSRRVGAGGSSAGGLESLRLTDAAPAAASFSAAPAPELKDGCTVEGYSTGQRFTTTWIETETDYTTLKLFLQGYEQDVQHAEPVVLTEEAPAPKPPRRTKKDHKLDDLEAENEALRQKLAELENQKLKEKLKELEG